MKKPRNSRRAFSLVELLCVIAIIGALIGFLMPAVQQVRESSRKLACKNRLRQVSLALQSFHASHRRMPPGTLGYETPVHLSLSQANTLASDPGNPYYFRNQQNTSWIVQILDELELQTLRKKLPQICFDRSQTYADYIDQTPGAPAWLDGFSAVKDASSTALPLLLCPSDSLPDVATTCDNQPSEAGGLVSCLPMSIGAQPSFVIDMELDRLLGVPVSEFDLAPSGTNFLGCTGAYSGGELPEDLLLEFPGMDRYEGIFRSRRSLALGKVRDGTSNTVILGESIGFIFERKRSGPSSWFFGGLGRANSFTSDWGRANSHAIPGLQLFGDSWYAYPASFGSMHPAGVNFARADGSVDSISRAIDVQVFYAGCGANDGDIVTVR